jgi:hypothetical protein
MTRPLLRPFLDRVVAVLRKSILGSFLEVTTVNRLKWGTAVAAAVTLALSAGCGGDDSGANYPDTGTDATAQPESSTRDGSVAESSMEASTREGGAEAASETGTPEGGCVVPEGGSPCTPGEVTCDNAPCDVPSNFCCATQGAQGVTEACDSIGTSCSGLSEGCDETADCSSGSICCLVTSLSSASVACQAGTACAGGIFSIQVCKTDAECDNAMPCVPQTCMLEGATVTIEACGSVPTCTPL